MIRGSLAALCALLVLGCGSTGVRVVASSATYTNIGDIDWDTYKIPVLSIYTGPKTTIWINKDYSRIADIEVTGCVTNNTSALALYDSRERKAIRMKISFDPCATNRVDRK